MDLINFSENINVGNHVFHLQSQTNDDSHIIISLYENGELLSKQRLKVEYSSTAKRVLHDQVHEKHNLIKKGILHLFQQYKSIDLIDNIYVLVKMVFLFTKWKLFDEGLQTLCYLESCLSKYKDLNDLELLNDYIDQIKMILKQKNDRKALALLKLVKKEIESNKQSIMSTELR